MMDLHGNNPAQLAAILGEARRAAEEASTADARQAALVALGETADAVDRELRFRRRSLRAALYGQRGWEAADGEGMNRRMTQEQHHG